MVQVMEGLDEQTSQRRAEPNRAGDGIASPRSKAKGSVLRGLVSLMFCAAGVCHFVFPNAYLGIMPPYIPWHLAMVFISGAFEIAGGIGILLPRFRKAAGIGLVALLIAVFPANIQMLWQEWVKNGFQYSFYSILLALRLPLQAFFVWIVCRAAFPKKEV